MIDLYPSLRATIKADSYFATTLAGFLDADGNFKVFREDEAPGQETPFITIEQPQNSEQRNTFWMNQQVIFHVTGRVTDWSTLYALARKLRDIFRAATAFTAVGSADAIKFELLGPATTGNDRDPVTEQVIVSLGLTFGIVDDA